jgi:predicted phage terminase large subunit-like protein
MARSAPKPLPAAERRAIKQAAREELAVRSLVHFVRGAWHIVEPSTRLVGGWHIDLICDELEAVTRGECNELVICVPPGHMKSLLVSVFWPAWQWLQRPGERTMHLSNDESLTIRDARKTRSILSSDWYRRLVTRKAISDGDATFNPATSRAEWTQQGSNRPGEHFEAWRFAGDQNTKANYANEPHQGQRICLSMWGKITGKRTHGAAVDDPYDVKEVLFGGEGNVAAKMKRGVEIYDGAVFTRLNRPRWRVTVMQRLHERDLAGVLIGRGVRHVVLPAVFDAEHPHKHERDLRKPGELLCPAVHNEQDDVKMRRSLGARAYAAQYSQRPQAAQGGIFKRRFFKRYAGDPQRLHLQLGGFDAQAISVDCTFRKTVGSDYVVLTVWGKKGLDRYLLDEVRGKMELPETAKALIALSRKWPGALLKLIETKANGDALVQVLRNTLPGLVGYDPKASKEARAQVAALDYEAGHAYHPDPIVCPWIVDFEDELCGFPAAANDDRVDTVSQMFIRWQEGALDNPLERMRRETGFLH